MNASAGADEDDTHDGGEHKNTTVTITAGPHKRKKGKVIGGGHGLFLVELSGREKGTILKTNEQFKRTDGVAVEATSTKSELPSQSSRSSSRSSSRNSKEEDNVAVSARSSRPRRTNAGVNKKSFSSSSSSNSSKAYNNKDDGK